MPPYSDWCGNGRLGGASIAACRKPCPAYHSRSITSSPATTEAARPPVIWRLLAFTVFNENRTDTNNQRGSGSGCEASADVTHIGARLQDWDRGPASYPGEVASVGPRRCCPRSGHPIPASFEPQRGENRQVHWKSASPSTKYIAVQSFAALGRGSALTSRLVQQAIPVVDVCVENSLAHPLQTLYVLNRLDGTTGPCLGNPEANLALQEKQPLGLGDPARLLALVSPFPEDFLISRRFLHGLNPFQERFCQFIRIAQPHQQVRRGPELCSFRSGLGVDPPRHPPNGSPRPVPAPPGSLRPRAAGLRPAAPPRRRPCLRSPASLPYLPWLSGQTAPRPGESPGGFSGGRACSSHGTPSGRCAGRSTSTRPGPPGSRPPRGRSGRPRLTDCSSPRRTNPSTTPRRSHACHTARTHSAVSGPRGAFVARSYRRTTHIVPTPLHCLRTRSAPEWTRSPGRRIPTPPPSANDSPARSSPELGYLFHRSHRTASYSPSR